MGWRMGLLGSYNTVLCLLGRHRPRLKRRYLFVTSFVCSLGSCSLHRGDVCIGSRHLHTETNRSKLMDIIYQQYPYTKNGLNPRPASLQRKTKRPTKMEIHWEPL